MNKTTATHNIHTAKNKKIKIQKKSTTDNNLY